MKEMIVHKKKQRITEKEAHHRFVSNTSVEEKKQTIHEGNEPSTEHK